LDEKAILQFNNSLNRMYTSLMPDWKKRKKVLDEEVIKGL
jgi:hypothetical protein